MNQIATIEQNRQLRYERHEAYQRFEEATDIAERIGYPIDHRVQYEMRGSLVYAEFDKQNRPFRELTDESRREGHKIFTGVNAFEAIRRECEHQEALMVDAFGRGELDGTVLVKISPVPDAVRNGTADIDGYRRDLLRSFVRIYYRTENGVSCRLFSLDKSDRAGMAAVGDLLGISTSERSSEDILGDHVLVDMGENISDEAITGLVEQTKSVYDQVLELQTGEQYHAGSRMLNKNDALSLVLRHGTLLDEHMKGVTDIMSRALDPTTKKALLETQRKRTTAAMDIVEHGGVVGSSNDSAVTEQMSAKDYSGECATGTGLEAVGMSQGEKAKKKEKMVEGKHFDECMNCPNCKSGKGVWVEMWHHKGKKRTDYTCNNSACGATTLPDRRNEIQTESNKSVIASEQNPSSTDKLYVKAYGEYARVRTEISVGGADRVVYDSRTGEVITKL